MIPVVIRSFKIYEEKKKEKYYNVQIAAIFVEEIRVDLRQCFQCVHNLSQSSVRDCARELMRENVLILEYGIKFSSV